MYPWDHWKTVLPLAVGTVGLIGSFFYEKYVPTEPMIPLSLFQNRDAAVTYLGTTVHGMIVSFSRLQQMNRFIRGC